MKRPNFFIIGAPKCGTTALYEYLRPHPNVFLPDFKSPHYFAEDMPASRSFRSLDEYLAIFRGAGPQHLAVGEATVFYLYSQVAVAKILQFDPAARLIAMIRNPVEMIPALHNEYLFEQYEDEPRLEAAWDLQEPRRRGERLPAKCPAPQMLQYFEVAAFGRQLQRLFRGCPREQVKIIVFDDFAARTGEIYDEVLQFLEIPSDRRTDFRPINQRKAARWFWLQDTLYLYRIPLPLRAAGRKLGLHHVHRKLVQWNTASRAGQQVDAAFRQRLAEAFRQDVRLLSDLLDRDLMHWVAEPTKSSATD